jgi:glutaminyl-peptide cyclotransferase
MAGCQPSCNRANDPASSPAIADSPTSSVNQDSSDAPSGTIVDADTNTAQKRTPVGPKIDGDFAFEKIKEYEKFGPKVPGSTAHIKAGDWIVSELKKIGGGIFVIHEQKTTAKTFDGKKIPVRNIIAQINPGATRRYLLSAHWDNRPFADQDSGAKSKKPVPGVNDGGSGVAVLMAIAHAVHQEWYSLGSEYAKSSEKKDPPFGIDLAFWDAEDWGNPRGAPETYCLGSQYWAKNLVPTGYRAEFGINFDMVGRVGSLFPIEGHSARKAPKVVAAIQEAATTLGHQDLFPGYEVGPITDDHYFVMEGSGIPMADIIYMDPDGRFPPEWHTTDDTSDVISRDVLRAVAQVAIQVIWSR